MEMMEAARADIRHFREESSGELREFHDGRLWECAPREFSRSLRAATTEKLNFSSRRK
jgi:hypothetical protein